jgi:hypothetical protein
VVYRALERHLAETEEPCNVEAGLAKLKEWMQPDRQGPDGSHQPLSTGSAHSAVQRTRPMSPVRTGALSAARAI